MSNNSIIPTFFHEDSLLHNPEMEFSSSGMREYVESPERITLIKDTLLSQFTDIIELEKPELVQNTMDSFGKIHDKGYLEFLEDSRKLEKTMISSVFSLDRSTPPEESEDFIRKMGYYIYDAGTPFTSTTYRAAIASTSSALSAAKEIVGNHQTTIGLCRPPGHHASSDYGGGYCYVNSVALAADWLVQSKKKTVAILDIDYHHGNGTQDIFYKRDDVLFVSIHADPHRYYPHYWGYKAELGEDNGKGYNLNLPVDPMNTDIGKYLSTLDEAIARIDEHDPEILLISAGLDAHIQDTIAGMKLHTEDYYQIGKALAKYPKKIYIIEGGYSTEIGNAFCELLKGDMQG